MADDRLHIPIRSLIRIYATLTIIPLRLQLASLPLSCCC